VKLLRDSWVLFAHAVRMTMRNPVWVAFGLFQPVCYLLLFAPLLESVATAPGAPGGDALLLFTPGLLVMQGIFGTLFVGFGLIAALRAGVVERLGVTPVSRLALLLGNALRDVGVLAVQACLLVLMAFAFGLRASPAGVALALALIVLLGLSAAPASYALALALRDENALSSTLQFLLLPLLLLSGILLPLELAPPWMRAAAALNPFAHAVDAARAFFGGDLGDASILRGYGAMALLAALAVWWAARSYRRIFA